MCESSTRAYIPLPLTWTLTLTLALTANVGRPAKSTRHAINKGQLLLSRVFALLPTSLYLTMFSLSCAALVASGLGVASHLGFFIRGEHGRNGIHILQAAILLPSLSYLYLIYYADFTSLHAVLYTTAIFWSFTVSLWTSMLIYRGFFHPLRNFPGPSGAKYTKFWHSVAAADMKWYKTVNKMHEAYGDFVRTGKLPDSGTPYPR